MYDHEQTIARIDDVTHVYKEVRALDDVTLDIPCGQMVGLLGPDGVGKSTLLGLLAGLDLPSAGEVRLNGSHLEALDEDRRARLRGT